ncbi:MAG: tetratricopeptide repeat protein [Colwellia sp.]|nr:tetratricopeptide repeat protein [Colwellia sp.]
MIKNFLAFILLSSLFGCTNLNSDKLSKTENLQLPALQINHSLFSKDNLELLPAEALFELSKNQQDEFLRYYHQQLEQDIKPHQALANFLETRLANFTYYGETFIAEKSMRLNRGNCMSLAILTAALAKTVAIEISYREVKTLPVFEKYDNVILSSSHVQAVVYDPTFVPEKNFFYFNKPAIVIDYFPVNSNWTNKTVMKKTLLSMYYSNISAQFIVEGNLNAAFANAELAYQYDDTSSNITNLLAVLHRRKGDLATAEKFYLRTIKQDKNNLNALQNYAILLNSQQRYEQLELIEHKIDNLYDPNPYVWLEQAYIAKSEHKLKKAKEYFEKVITMAPYVHQAYLGLAQTYYLSGKKNKAIKTLESAIEWTYKEDERQRYKSKLYSLTMI